MTTTPQTRTSTGSIGVKGVLLRAAGFLCLWPIISGDDLPDLPVGAAAAVAAAWVSVSLLPPGKRRPNLMALCVIALRSPFQAMGAGADVARRALAPRLPLRPGFIVYPVQLPRGPARSAFAVLTGLLPGTVPIPSDKSEAFTVHCLDVSQPIEAQLKAEETLLQKALGLESRHG